MATTSIYLNFPGTTEKALRFYASVFGTEVAGIHRFGEMPSGEGMPPLSDEQKQRVMHGSVPIYGDHLLMASDTMEGFGPPHTPGNNFNISVNTDARDEADRLFAALGEGGEVVMPLADQFWGDYFGQVRDQFGISWMIHYSTTAA